MQPQCTSKSWSRVPRLGQSVTLCHTIRAFPSSSPFSPASQVYSCVFAVTLSPPLRIFSRRQRLAAGLHSTPRGALTTVHTLRRIPRTINVSVLHSNGAENRQMGDLILAVERIYYRFSAQLATVKRGLISSDSTETLLYFNAAYHGQMGDYILAIQRICDSSVRRHSLQPSNGDSNRATQRI